MIVRMAGRLRESGGASNGFRGQGRGGAYRTGFGHVNTDGPLQPKRGAGVLPTGAAAGYNRALLAFLSNIKQTGTMDAGFLFSKLKAARATTGRIPATFLHTALDLVFPPACAGCGAEMFDRREGMTSAPFCDACLDELVLFAGPTCGQCGAPVPDMSDALVRCVRCRGRKLWFDRTVALGEYTGRLRDLLLRMKQARGNATSQALAALTWDRCGERLAALEPDLVVPVPLHWQRRLVHGTNSAAVLATGLARRLPARLATRLLRRRRNTLPQFSLPPYKRWPNVRRAFAVRGGYPLGATHVLLVDDILTTGATCSEAARTLKAAGADRVSVVVAARTLTH